jgi:myo-inositol 2-dehydrogenase / D-chiro-inositol 1-dehydrogenase
MMTRPLSSPSRINRRDFLRLAAGTAASLSLPLILPSRLRGANAPSNRIRVAQIGCGRIARGHDMTGVFASGLADLVAVCDVDARRAADAKTLTEQLYREAGRTVPPIGVYGDYRELLARESIDAIVISTPDHWHAEPALAAVRARKAIYLQKPFTMTLEEGRQLRDAAQQSDVTFQIGSQQRSWEQFRRAAELIRSGRVGQVRRVEIGLPVDPTQPDDPVQPVPGNLDYDRWLGPTPAVPYTEQRVHPQHDYSRPGWLRNEAYCLGMITGWGSHHYDTLHWALNVEDQGPSRVEGRATFPPNSIWNVHGAYEVQLTYAGNVQVVVGDRFPNGLKFIGDDGWIFVSRDAQATASDPSINTGNLKPLDASDPRLLDPHGVTVQLRRSDSHHRDWLECMRSGQVPLAPAPVAHRSNSACIVSWIAMKLGRPLTWDVRTERFVGDEAANAMLARPERAPYGIKYL